jgi:NAD/NADP transhydrogenase beta subunit
MPEILTVVAYLMAGILFILSLAGLGVQEAAQQWSLPWY